MSRDDTIGKTNALFFELVSLGLSMSDGGFSEYEIETFQSALKPLSLWCSRMTDENGRRVRQPELWRAPKNPQD